VYKISIYSYLPFIPRIGRLCADLHEERFLARQGYRFAMHGYLALVAIAVARLAASRARTGAATLKPRSDRRCAALSRRGAFPKGTPAAGPSSDRSPAVASKVSPARNP
jgi:hypothetical protein